MTGSLKVVAYGGGVNTVALLVWCRRNGIVPTAIVMANPGSERRRTMEYLRDIVTPWLEKVGFPAVEVITREGEAKYRPRSKHTGTLEDECFRKETIPSVAFPPNKKCSQKYKLWPQIWWTERQPWALAERAAGRKMQKLIGYDAGEPRRIKEFFTNEDEAQWYVPSYPLFDAEIDRTGCVSLIESEGLPVPGKSACTFCPNNTLDDWYEIRDEEPEAFARAVAMSRRAFPSIGKPDIVGLMRNAMPRGKRQLHVWYDAGCPSEGAAADGDTMPCECAV